MFNWKIQPTLVCNGFNLTNELYYHEALNLMAKMTTIFLPLLIEALNDLFFHQLDINIDFLHGKLDE